MKFTKVLLSVVLFILFGVNFGNEPVLPPYHKYIVSGSVMCDTLIDKSNFTIQLYGKSNLYQNSFEAIGISALDYEIPVALTDTSGFYRLIVNNEFSFDSIKVALYGLRNQIIFSEVYPVSNEQKIPIESFIDNIETSSGCSSCSTEPEKVKRTIRYEYYLTTSVNYCY